jgi:hypothetical protein
MPRLTISTAVGHRTDPDPQPWSNQGRWGVCAPALKLHLAWEGPWKKGQGFKPDMGNPAVRHYRGAFGNVAVVDIFPRTAGAPEFYPNEPWPTWATKWLAARSPTF